MCCPVCEFCEILNKNWYRLTQRRTSEKHRGVDDPTKWENKQRVLNSLSDSDLDSDLNAAVVPIPCEKLTRRWTQTMKRGGWQCYRLCFLTSDFTNSESESETRTKDLWLWDELACLGLAGSSDVSLTLFTRRRLNDPVYIHTMFGIKET